MTPAPGGVWLSESLLDLYRVDARAGRVVRRVRIGAGVVAAQLIAAGEQLFAVGERTSDGTLVQRNTLVRLDATGNRKASLTPLPRGRLTAAYGGGSLWVGVADGQTLERVDPRRGTVVRRLHARLGDALAFAGGSLWTLFRGGTPERLAVR
jgi:hypothetical protein